MTYLWREFEDPDLRRMFQKYSRLGTSALPEDLNQRLIQAINNMKGTYAKATICDYKDRSKCDLHVEPGKLNLFFLAIFFEAAVVGLSPSCCSVTTISLSVNATVVASIPIREVLSFTYNKK